MLARLLLFDFRSDRAAAALAPGGAVGTDAPSQWQQQWVVNEPSGHVQEAGERVASSAV